MRSRSSSSKGVWVKRRFRLTRSNDFKRVRRLGKSYAHPLVVLLCTSTQESSARVAVSASKAVGGAVQRNLAKRRLKEAIRGYIHRVKPGTDLILFARAAVLRVKFEELQSVMERLLARAGILTLPANHEPEQVDIAKPERLSQ